MDRLKGKVALITGAANGLGEADARLFAQEGATVIVADINAESGQRVAEEIGDNADFMNLDVCSEASWEKAMADILDRYGKLDVLVNNAGISGLGSPEKITEAQYDAIMAVSVKGTVLGCKHGILAMKQSGGSIINMSSVASITGEYYCAAYTAAKGAVEAYTRAVAVHCAQSGLKIRCNSVHPAAIATAMADVGAAVQAHSVEQWEDGWAPPALKNAFGEPNDVAYMLVYLASDESCFISGQKFVVDFTSTVTLGHVPS